MVENSHKICSTGERNGKPLHYSFLENAMKSIERQKDRTLKDKFPRSVSEVAQSCPTLCDPIDSNLLGSPVPGILQARTLEWVAISFSNVWNWKVKVKSLSHVRPSATPWTAAYQAPPSMGFPRQEYWSGVSLPSLTQYAIGGQWRNNSRKK